MNIDKSGNKYSLEFTGSGSEFFKIWIVNIMLSIVTLGIYSAWAKVRTKRYFYSNTWLMGSTFDYLGDPVKILKGRIIAVILFALYSFTGSALPTMQPVIMLIFSPIIPWVVIKSLKFNNYNSDYRNIRFHFKSSYLTALWGFIILPVLTFFSAGLAYPYFIRAVKKFIIDHTAYGTSHFALKASVGDFYILFIKVVSMTVLFLLFIFSVISFGIYFLGERHNDLAEQTALIIIISSLSIVSIIIFMFTFTYAYVARTNLIFSNIVLKNCRFESRENVLALRWQYVHGHM